MRALSVFCGAGGLDYGASLVGAQTILATDIDADALSTLSRVSGANTLAGELGSLLESGALREMWSGPPPDILLGGPPCTAFSHAGFWLRYKREGEDPAAQTLSSYLETIRQFRPRSFVMENVPGLLFKNHRHHLAALDEGFRSLGYGTRHTVLQASDFGVAQARRRLFVVGLLGSTPPDLTHWPHFSQRTASWALGNSDTRCPRERDEIPSGRYLDLLRSVPPGGNYLVHTKERGCLNPAFRYRGRYWSFLLKADPDRPAPTIPAQRVTWNGPFHWSSRHLRVGELSRLQSFPDAYPFATDLNQCRRQIGNAVPPLLACAVVWRLSLALGHEPKLPAALERLNDPLSSYEDVLPSLSIESRAR